MRCHHAIHVSDAVTQLEMAPWMTVVDGAPGLVKAVEERCRSLRRPEQTD